MSKDLIVNEEEKALAIASEQNEFFSEMGADDFTVPFTRVLADMSAPVKEGLHPAGLIYNSGSGEAVKELEVVIVRHPEKTITVRTEDGEFVASYPFTADLLKDLTETQDGLKRWDKDGNSVYETWNYYIMDAATGEVSICPMLSSNYSVAKAWNTRMRVQKKYAPTSMVWKLTTKESGSGKRTFWMFATPTFKGQVTAEQEDLVAFAKDMFANAVVDHSKGFDNSSDEDTIEESDF